MNIQRKCIMCCNMYSSEPVIEDPDDYITMKLCNSCFKKHVYRVQYWTKLEWNCKHISEENKRYLKESYVFYKLNKHSEEHPYLIPNIYYNADSEGY